MNATKTHTPGPWFKDKLTGGADYDTLAVVTKNVTVAEIPASQGADAETMEANAALICERVNGWEGLKAENERLRGALEGLKGENGCWCFGATTNKGPHTANCNEVVAALGGGR